jgi:ACS family tartrate transporter-like MFS transporter
LNNASLNPNPLDSARRKAYWHLLPLLFCCYVVAYVDRANVSIAKLTMSKDMPAFNNEVIGFGAGLFFLGYFLLEVPSAVLIEKWSARRLLTRIMVIWGVMAALTAVVRTPFQFYGVRFFLGLAEAGFFPGVVVYLSHWFPSRDRSKAVACFIVATPMAQLVSPKISNALLKIGTDELINGATIHHPTVLGLVGWQWVYIAWGLPAVLLGLYVFLMLPDRPRDAKWLTPEERGALEEELAREKALRAAGRPRMTALEALSHPKVLLLAAAYFCSVSANYSIDFFLPSILQQWYSLKINDITWLIMLPPVLALSGQLFVGWNSDRTKERRLHAIIPIMIGAIALGFAPFAKGYLPLGLACFIVAMGGIKSYQPAFWALPNLFLTEVAAATSIGLINSIGNLGGFLGPYIMGAVQQRTGSFVGAIFYLSASMLVSATILLLLGLGRREKSG